MILQKIIILLFYLLWFIFILFINYIIIFIILKIIFKIYHSRDYTSVLIRKDVPAIPSEII